ncbi:MAG: transcriptional repressor [Anaerolineaceae bacterium]|nr:transcriptional repressor [Anaerolineaceae bacterium]
MRASSVVQAILEVLEEEDTHLTSREIYGRIHARLPAVNPSTVYRALERLSQEGVVSISDMGLGAMVYELLSAKNHHHLICQQCHHVLTLEGGETNELFSKLEASTGYRLMTNHLVLFGICPHCQEEPPEV